MIDVVTLGKKILAAPIILAGHEIDDLAVERQISTLDDAYWWRIIHGPFSWQLFTSWWVARRYVMPRDIRKDWR